MLAAYPSTIAEPSYSSYAAVLPQHRMIARARSYTASSSGVSPTALGGGPDGRSSRACSCDRAPALRRCASEGGYVPARPTPWTHPAPLAVPLPARVSAVFSEESTTSNFERAKDDASVEPPERHRKVLRPTTPVPVPASAMVAQAIVSCPVPAVAEPTAVSSLPRKKVSIPAGKLNKLSIVQAQQLASLGGLCHDIGMAEDPNERWREHHEDTAIVLLRLHRTARVGTTRSGGVLVPQRTKTTTRARSSSTGHMKVEQPPASPLVSQKSQGPPTGLVRQKSTRAPQRKCRSLSDVYGLRPLSTAALCSTETPPPEPLSSPGPEAAGVGMIERAEPPSPVGNTPLVEQDDMIFAGLFDGHGGDGCARFLQQHVYRNLSREISMRRLQQTQPDASTADLAGSTAVAAELAPITPELMHDAFTSAYLMSNLQLRSSSQISVTSGSTAATAVLTTGTAGSRWLHLANVGDTAAVLCIANPEKANAWEPHRLHQTHRPTTPSERARVISTGGFILRGRLNGTLAVTRAFGNHGSPRGCGTSPGASVQLPPTTSEGEREQEEDFYPCGADEGFEGSTSGVCARTSMEGLSVLPATRSVRIGDDAVFLVLCCDGVTDVMTDAQIIATVHEGYSKLLRRCEHEQRNQHQADSSAAAEDSIPQGDGSVPEVGETIPPTMRGVAGKLARWLVHSALKRGSRDNCSAIILLF